MMTRGVSATPGEKARSLHTPASVPTPDARTRVRPTGNGRGGRVLEGVRPRARGPADVELPRPHGAVPPAPAGRPGDVLRVQGGREDRGHRPPGRRDAGRAV